jgi:hypothetical protein
MKLFADIYLDEDVSVLVAVLLRGRGLDAVTAVAEGMLGQDDSAQLARAASMARCVVTHNRSTLSCCIASTLRLVVTTPASSSPRVAPRTRSRVGSCC